MDLLGQETIKPQKSKGKKIVLTLLIISIVLLVVLLILLYALKSNVSKALTLSVNGKNAQIADDLLIQDENENTYINIETVADLVGYDFLEGGYLEYEENKNKSHIDTTKQIIEYEVNNNEICKITPKSELEQEHYKLKHNIIKQNDKLYISLEDLNIGCNLVYRFSEQDNQILINTTESLIIQCQESLTKKNLKLDNSSSNQKGMLYNMMVVSNDMQKMGVLTLTEDSIIGYKYSSMEFDEYTQRYIVSSEGKYGVISKEGKEIIETKYESIRIINYKPLIYEVKLNNKYGVLSETGKIAINMEYDKIGFRENSNLIEPALIINNLDNKQTGIVVGKNNKYGIVNLQTGKIIVECQLDKIYSKASNSKEKEYYIKLGENEIKLDEYIDYINTTIVTN